MTASGQLRLPSCWSSVPVKSSVSSSPDRVAAQHDAQVALAGLEHVLGAPLAVLQLGQAGAGAALGIVEDLGVGLAQRLDPDPLARAGPSAARPTRPAASWARRSARRWSGRRICSDSSAIASSSSTRGSMTTPSSSRVRLSAGIEPGVGPPTSA